MCGVRKDERGTFENVLPGKTSLRRWYLNKDELEVKEEIKWLSQGSTIHAEKTATAKALGWRWVWPVQQKLKEGWVSGAQGSRGGAEKRPVREDFGSNAVGDYDPQEGFQHRSDVIGLVF